MTLQLETDDPRPTVRSGYCDCGQPLVRTSRATMSSPEEWLCPQCDGGLAPGEYERWTRLYEEGEGDTRYDDRRENPEDYA